MSRARTEMTRPTIDELEVLTPDQLGKLLLREVYKNYPDIRYIQDLLDVGCPIDARDNIGWTALHHAANKYKIEVMEYLISKGADIHISNNAGNRAWNLAPDKIRKSCPELEPK